MAVTQSSATTDNQEVDAPRHPQVERSAADIRRESDGRHQAFLDGIRTDILASAGDEQGRHQQRLIRALESDVLSLTEQRDRAEAEVVRARAAEGSTFDRLMEALRGWSTSESARQRLQGQVDSASTWPPVVALGLLVLAGIAFALISTGVFA